MMSSDLRDSYLYTAGVVLAYAGGFADRAASFSLTNLQLHMPVDLGIERQCLSCYSTVHYAGRLV